MERVNDVTHAPIARLARYVSRISRLYSGQIYQRTHYNLRKRVKKRERKKGREARGRKAHELFAHERVASRIDTLSLPEQMDGLPVDCVKQASHSGNDTRKQIISREDLPRETRVARALERTRVQLAARKVTCLRIISRVNAN